MIAVNADSILEAGIGFTAAATPFVLAYTRAQGKAVDELRGLLGKMNERLSRIEGALGIQG